MNQTAQQLKAHGLGAFPCLQNKMPAVPKGTSWKDWAHAELNALPWPSDIVGVPIPSGVVVLDLDTYKGITREYVEAGAGFAIPWDAAHIQTTQSGGQHYAFRAPNWPVKNISNAKHNETGVQFEGLDVRSAGKGYIATGEPYYTPTHLGGALAMAFPQMLPPLPEGLRPWLEAVAHESSERVEVTDEDAKTIREALRHIDPGETREEWVKVGLSLKSGFGDDPQGLSLFDEWSSGALWRDGDEPANYVPEHIETQWDSFKAEGGRTIATVYHKAIEGGWQPPAGINAFDVFGEGATDSTTFAAIVDSLQQHGGDPKQTQTLIDTIIALPCSDMQRAMLAATLSRELKDADLLTKEVRAQIARITGNTAAGAASKVPVTPKGQRLAVNQPMHPDLWAPFHTTGKDMKPRGTIDNFEIMMSAYGVQIGFDEISKELSIVVPGVNYGGALKDEAALSEIESIGNLNHYPKSDIKGMIAYMAHRYAHNPVKAWVESAPWDGLDHVGLLFSHITLTPDEDRPMCEHLFRKWMRAAVSAGVGDQEGCEPVLVFVDEQGGVGKTRFFRTLCPEPFRADSVLLDVKDKDSVKQAISYWLVELGELDGTFSRSESNALKAFLSRTKDDIRLPYGRTNMKYPRMTAYVGSVNEAEFLVDTTSNRRFIPMKVAALNHQHRVNTQQAWAQALAEARSGAVTYVEAHEVAERNASFQATSAIDDVLSSRLNEATGERNVHMTVTDLLKRCGMHNPTKRDLNDAGKWLRSNGYEKRIRSGVRGFMLPDMSIGAQAFGGPQLEVVK
ncbi:putative integrase [Vibrio phage VP16C]|nr:putative integrase [Vibrio phage VP16C]